MWEREGTEQSEDGVGLKSQSDSFTALVHQSRTLQAQGWHLFAGKEGRSGKLLLCLANNLLNNIHHSEDTPHHPLSSDLNLLTSIGWLALADELVCVPIEVDERLDHTSGQRAACGGCQK